MWMALPWSASCPADALLAGVPAWCCAKKPATAVPKRSSRRPTMWNLEAIGAGLAVREAERSSLTGMAFLLLRRGRVLFPRIEFLQDGQGFFRPAEMGFHFQLAITGCHAPEKRFRAVLMFGDFLLLDAGEFFEQRTVFQNHALHVADEDGNWNLRPEEELEKHFIARDFRLWWCAEPLHQLRAALCGDGVDLAIGLAPLLLGLRGDEAGGGKLLEVGGNLSITLAPDVADRGANVLAEIITGHGLNGEKAEKGFA